MRQKRAKTYRKLMHQYQVSFGFRQPYQVLVDEEFCQDVVRYKIEAEKRLPDVVQGQVKPMITQCSMEALYKLGKPAQPAVDLAKTFERRKCNHREAIAPQDCITQVVGPTNQHRYILASSSRTLRDTLRLSVPGLPMIHINRSVTILEPPSKLTLRAQREKEEQKLRLPVVEKELLGPSAAGGGGKTASNVIDGSRDESVRDGEGAGAGQSVGKVAPERKQRKGPKGPNPLSVKKKKPKEAVSSSKGKEKEDGRSEGQDGRGKDVGDKATPKKRKRESEQGEAGEARQGAGTPMRAGAEEGERGGDDGLTPDVREGGRRRKRKRANKRRQGQEDGGGATRMDDGE